MKTIGVICEYNPFHLGHQKQLHMIRDAFGADCRIVCLMSGNFVQRGEPAIFDKSLRAEAAVRSGADLVLEMPIGVTLSSAEGFADGSVRILSSICDILCFGVESLREEALYETAHALLSDEYSVILKEMLGTGISFPTARQLALKRMGLPYSIDKPNDTLGVEYTKAILSQGSKLEIFPIIRFGNYHATQVDPENPSATSLRASILNGSHWMDAVPDSAFSLFENATPHFLSAGERAILFRLRTMTDSEFEALPYGSEGLWRRLMKQSRQAASISQIAESVKSKRYTRTRIDRMIICAYLSLTNQDIGLIPDVIRVLAFSEKGRQVIRIHSHLRNTGEPIEHSYQLVENRIGALYGLFAFPKPDVPDVEKKRRVVFCKEIL